MLRKEIEVKGYCLEYYTKGKGKSLVFIHGLAMSPKSYNEVIDKLGKRYRVFAPTVPGHGNSVLPEDMSVEFCVNVFYEFIRKMGLKPIVVGHSQGGLLAMHLAKKHPKVVRKVVVVDGAGIAEKKSLTVFLLELVTGAVLSVRSFHGVVVLLREAFTFGRSLVKYGWNRCARRYVRELLSSHESVIKKIRTKTIIVWGASDMVLPLRDGERMHELIPGSELVVVEGNHGWLLMDVRRFFDLIKQYV